MILICHDCMKTGPKMNMNHVETGLVLILYGLCRFCWTFKWLIKFMDVSFVPAIFSLFALKHFECRYEFKASPNRWRCSRIPQIEKRQKNKIKLLQIEPKVFDLWNVNVLFLWIFQNSNVQTWTYFPTMLDCSLRFSFFFSLLFYSTESLLLPF